MTEHELPRTKIRNIEWIYSGNDFNLQKYSVPLHSSRLGSVRLICLFKSTAISPENMHGLEKGVGIALFKLLIRDGLIAVDLNKQINLTEPRRAQM